MTLEDIYVTTFNEIFEGKYTVVKFKPCKPLSLKGKEKEKNVLIETRNTLLYEWYKDNNQLDLIEGLFDYVLIPNTDPDLKGCDFNEIAFIVSPETRRALGIRKQEMKKVSHKTKERVESGSQVKPVVKSKSGHVDLMASL